MIKRILKKQVIIPLALVFCWIIISVIAYFYLPFEKAKDFASFISGLSTVGLLILTTFYVIYTNKQIRELQKQRQLQIQPLPNVNVTEAVLTSPRIVTGPPSFANIKLIVELHFKYKIKNVGNGAAVLVDSFAFFIGNEIKSKKGKYIAKRNTVLEVGQELEENYRVRDEAYEVIKALNKGSDNISCPVETAFDVLIKHQVLYKNIFGSAFLLKQPYIVAITDKEQERISNWIASLESFENEFSNDIAKFKATHQRNKEDAFVLFDEIKKKFYTKCPIEILPISLMPLFQGFNVEPIESDALESILKQIHHGIPVSVGNMKKTKETTEFEIMIKKHYFDVADEA